MTYFLSVLTSVKDYIEITHKLIETDPSFGIKDYTEFGAVFTYIIICINSFITEFLSFSWLTNIWSLPIIVPDIASSMISEISVLDGYFHNAFTFLDTPLSHAIPEESTLALYYGQQNIYVYGFEKFLIGLINSFFLFLPTSTAHFITFRRFLMQGSTAGSIAALGTIAGNFLWLTSIIFGWRFFIIPWLSFDIFRYLLGFCLIVKYLWDSAKERRMTSDQLSNANIFLLNFLLALTEQTCIYPFITNLSIGPETSILEGFPVNEYNTFIFVHASYLFGILIGSLSLLQLGNWFWEEPAVSIYMWMISPTTFFSRFFRLDTGFFYKPLKFTLTYLTVLFGMFSIPYYGLDYLITNPLGFVPQDRLLDEKQVNPLFFDVTPNPKLLREFSFLGVKATDSDLRKSSNVKSSKMAWHEKSNKMESLDFSLYDQGIYDVLTLEDLNYGFDRHWFERKIKKHDMRFIVLPGPIMRAIKRRMQMRTVETPEFFRLLVQQYYTPIFHEYNYKSNKNKGFSFLENFMKKSKSSTLSYIPKNKRKINNEILALTNNISVVERLRRLEQLSGQKKDQQSHSFFSAPIFSAPIPHTPDTYNKAQNAKDALSFKVKHGLLNEFSALRKFSRNLNNRIKTSIIPSELADSVHPFLGSLLTDKTNTPAAYKHTVYNSQPIYSKRWKDLFGQWSIDQPNIGESNQSNQNNQMQPFHFLRNVAKTVLMPKNYKKIKIGFEQNYDHAPKRWANKSINAWRNADTYEKTILRQKLSKKERQILRYKSLLLSNFKTLPTAIYTPCTECTNVASSAQGPQGPQGVDLVKLKTKTMLHPLKFYLQKEQAFRRKLKFYGTNIVRKLAVGNNGPSFQAMMKHSFYYYKPTLRWRRTVLQNRLQTKLSKRSRTSRRLSFTNTKNKKSAFTNTKYNTFAIGGTPYKIDGQIDKIDGQTDKIDGTQTISANNTSHIKDSPMALEPFTRGLKPTHTYTSRIKGKYSARYRYEIYKDLLRHWYYSTLTMARVTVVPDVDAFIRRQPTFHFLTKKEEGLLHLRRFLLSQHYDSLRWYTYMQHYRSMKNRIGGTKSFASRPYNQQFYGTFKKIRHLFAITPSQGEKTILKFDQPLYNEYPNNSTSSLLEQSVIHEELLSNHEVYHNSDIGFAKSMYYDGIYRDYSMPEDLVDQSSKIIREYISETTSNRESHIKKLINTKDYSKLTPFLFNGTIWNTPDQDLIPSNPDGVYQSNTENNTQANQETANLSRSQALLLAGITESTNAAKLKAPPKMPMQPINNTIDRSGEETISAEIDHTTDISEDIYELELRDQFDFETALGLQFLKQFNKRYISTKAMRTYIIETLNSAANHKEKTVNKHIEKFTKLDDWLKNYEQMPTINQDFVQQIIPNFKKESNLVKTGVQKALNDGSSILNDINPYFNSKHFRKFKRDTFKLKKNSKIQLEYNSELKREQQVLTSLNQIHLVLDQKTQPSDYTEPLHYIAILDKLHRTQPLTNAIKQTIQTIHKFLLFLCDIPPKDKWAKTQWQDKYEAKEDEAMRLSKGFKRMDAIAKKNVEFNKRRAQDRLVNSLDVETKTGLILKGMSTLSPDKVKKINTRLTGSTMAPPYSKEKIESKGSTSFKKDGDVHEVYQGTDKEKNFWATLLFDSEDERQYQKRYGPKSWFFIENSVKKAYIDQKRQYVNQKKHTFNPISSPNAWTKWLSFQPFPKQVVKETDTFKHIDTSLVEPTVDTFPSLFYKPEHEATQSKKTVKKRPRPITDPEEIQNIETAKFIQSKYIKPNSEFEPRGFNHISKRIIKKERLKSVNLKKSVPQTDVLKHKMMLLRSKLHYIQLSQQFPNWWWNFYLPRILNSIAEEMKRYAAADMANMADMADMVDIESIPNPQIKPLSKHEVQQITQKLVAEYLLCFGSFSETPPEMTLAAHGPEVVQPVIQQKTTESFKPNHNVLNKIYENIFLNKHIKVSTDYFISEMINPLPFYAGWDESLRKFVVTNKLLSRREAGFQIKNVNKIQNFKKNYDLLTKPTEQPNTINFTEFPIQGLSDRLSRFWQKDISASAFETDQLNVGVYMYYTPLNWRRFQFRHTILKNWLNLGASLNQKTPRENALLVKNKAALKMYLKEKIVNPWNMLYVDAIGGLLDDDGNLNEAPYPLPPLTPQNLKEQLYGVEYEYENNHGLGQPESIAMDANKIINKDAKNLLQKYKRIRNLSSQKPGIRKKDKFQKNNKKSTKIWGSLIAEVLPSHYMTIFEYQPRLQEERYLNNTLQTAKDGITMSVIEYTNSLVAGSISAENHFSAIPDFTFRKGIQTNFKYHRKRPYSSFIDSEFMPYRRMFVTDSYTDINQHGRVNEHILHRWRPGLKTNVKPTNEKTKNKPNRLVSKNRKKAQHVFRPTVRFRPRYGGFTWPGDYLRLENINIPKLGLMSPESIFKLQKPVNNASPAAYLLQKHNITVLKKRLQKAQINPNLIHIAKTSQTYDQIEKINYKDFIKNKKEPLTLEEIFNAWDHVLTQIAMLYKAFRALV